MQKHISTSLFLALAFLLTAGCSLPQVAMDHRQPVGMDALHGSLMVNDMLFFGLSRSGSEVTQAEWQEFLGEVVTPRFPKGLTVWEANGQWQGEDRTITAERSKVLLLIHSDEPEYDAAVEEITRIYKQRFEQESVMRARSAVRVSF